MVGRKIIFLLHIAVAFALPLSDSTEQPGHITVIELQSTEKKPAILSPDADYDILVEEGSASNESLPDSTEGKSNESTSEPPTMTPTCPSILVQPENLTNECFTEARFNVSR